MSGAARPFDGLDPGVILDAAERFGVRCDGRLLALNSFENRVYQIGVEDGGSVVAKFYRPERWTDEAILEEHRFAHEFADREIPVVPPERDADGNTLPSYAGFRYGRNCKARANAASSGALSGACTPSAACAPSNIAPLSTWRVMVSVPRASCWKATCCRRDSTPPTGR
jgi:hypothetical protein